MFSYGMKLPPIEHYSIQAVEVNAIYVQPKWQKANTWRTTTKPTSRIELSL